MKKNKSGLYICPPGRWIIDEDLGSFTVKRNWYKWDDVGSWERGSFTIDDEELPSLRLLSFKYYSKQL